MQYCQNNDPHIRDWESFLPTGTLQRPVLQVINRAISIFFIKQAGLKPTEAKTGAVTLIHRLQGGGITGWIPLASRVYSGKIRMSRKYKIKVKLTPMIPMEISVCRQDELTEKETYS